MDSVKRIANDTMAIGLQLTGLAYKVQQGGKVSEEQLRMFNMLTRYLATWQMSLRKQMSWKAVCRKKKNPLDFKS